MAAGTPIPYALVNGARFSPVSAEIRWSKPFSIVMPGYKSITYSRKRSRVPAKGQNVDPLGKTRGTNAYAAAVEMHLPEFNQMIALVGDGYGDMFFSLFITYNETPLDVVTDELIGCTWDGTEANVDQTSDDPLYRMIDLTPIKIKFRGIDDNAVPLAAPVL